MGFFNYTLGLGAVACFTAACAAPAVGIIAHVAAVLAVLP